jgi:hypothetical protein
MWLPHFEGTIKTDDGADILFRLEGYNHGVTDQFDNEHRSALCSFILLSADPRYRWVNDVF